jgi:hypothetical protein
MPLMTPIATRHLLVRWGIRLGIALGALVLILYLVILVTIYRLQDKMLFHPRGNPSGWEQMLENGATRIDFTTSQGAQTSYYMGDPTIVPDTLWVFFPGNGSVALDWYNYTRDWPNSRTGFLLVETPGFGLSAGERTPETILEATDGSFAALAKKLSTTEQQLERNLGTFGHSMGAATSLQWAVKRPVKRCFLLAPYKSLRSMAAIRVTPLLAIALKYNFDNVARLKELAARPEPPRILILHGTYDNTIPVAHGRELATRFPNMVELREIPGGDHELRAEKRTYGYPFIRELEAEVGTAPAN